MIVLFDVQDLFCLRYIQLYLSDVIPRSNRKNISSKRKDHQKLLTILFATTNQLNAFSVSLVLSERGNPQNSLCKYITMCTDVILSEL